MTSPSDELLTAALGYAKRGWPVFPLVPRDKQPITRTGFKEASTERDTILTWWAVTPSANIGIATGVAFDVLDLDGPEGRDGLITYLNSLGITYVHDGPLAQTGKGLHLLFAPTGAGNRAHLLDTPIDFRGKGGYIVAPPSIHPLGHRYQWHKNERAEPPPAPEWLTALLEKKEAKPPPVDRTYNPYAPAAIPTTKLTRDGEKRNDRPNIIAVAEGLGLVMKHQAGYTLAVCPFHKDRTPSLHLTTHDNRFFCHGCGANGDSYDLQHKRDMHGRKFL